MMKFAFFAAFAITAASPGDAGAEETLTRVSITDPRVSDVVSVFEGLDMTKVVFEKASVSKDGLVRLENVRTFGPDNFGTKAAVIDFSNVSRDGPNMTVGAIKFSDVAIDSWSVLGPSVKAQNIEIGDVSLIMRGVSRYRLKFGTFSAEKLDFIKEGRTAYVVSKFDLAASDWFASNEFPRTVSLDLKADILKTSGFPLKPGFPLDIPVHITGGWRIGDDGLGNANLSVNTTGFGSYSFSVDAEGLVRTLFSNVRDMEEATRDLDEEPARLMVALMSSLARLKISSAALNASGLEWMSKAIADDARRSGIVPEVHSRTTAHEYAGHLSGLASDGTVDEVADALTSVFTGQSTFSARLAPATPVGVLELFAGAAATGSPLDTLGLKVGNH